MPCADVAAQQALADDANHQRVVKVESAEHAELRARNQRNLVLPMEIGIEKNASADRTYPTLIDFNARVPSAILSSG